MLINYCLINTLLFREGPHSLNVTVCIKSDVSILFHQNAKSCIVNIESLYRRIVSDFIPYPNKCLVNTSQIANVNTQILVLIHVRYAAIINILNSFICLLFSNKRYVFVQNKCINCV